MKFIVAPLILSLVIGFADPELPDVPDAPLPPANPALDIVKMPTGVAVANLIGVIFQDQMHQKAFEKGLENVIKTIVDKIENPSTGYLILHQQYRHPESGQYLIPADRLIVPIKAGVSPIDALAESYRQDRLTPPSVPAAMQNVSRYLWVKKVDGTIEIHQEVSRELLEQAALEEARIRDIISLGNPFYATYKQIGRTQYWHHVHQTYVAALQDQKARAEVEKLISNMNALEKQMDEVYETYQDLEREMREQQQRLAILNGIATLVQVVDAGIQAGSALSTPSGTPINLEGQAAPPVQDQIINSQSQITITGNRITVTRDALSSDINTINLKALEIDSKFEQGNVPFTPPPPLILP